MKKAIALLTAMLFVFALAGCASNDTQQQKATAAAETQQANTQKSDAEANTDAERSQEQTSGSESKTPVVYFSATGTT